MEPRSINARAGRLSRPEQHSWFSVLGIKSKSKAQASNTSILPPCSSPSSPSSVHPSNTSSFQSYYTANSALSYSTMNSASMRSSEMSSPYSVTSINSRKSRKNVLYPRRAHPLPVAVESEHLSISSDALILQVRFLCTTLLPHVENRLVPAGILLLQSSGLHGNSSQPVPFQTDERTRRCSELFITLTHEVLLKDVVSAVELEGPCKLLHTTFESILFKSGVFYLPTTPKLNEAGLNASSAGALALEWFSSVSVLRALSGVLDAFKGALDSIKPAAAKDEPRHNHYRMALLGLAASTGLTMEQYRKKLYQSLTQTEAQLNSVGRPEGLLPPPTSVMPMILPYQGAPKAMVTIEEGSEAEGEGSSTNVHTWSHVIQNDKGSEKPSLPRRILRRLIPFPTSQKA